MFQDAGLNGKTVLITGGSRGIGRATVRLLANQGAQVFFFYQRNQAAADELVTELQQHDWQVKAMQVDVREYAVCEQAVEAIYDQTGRLDILVNNSGITRDNLVMGLSDDDIRDVLDTNVLGVFNMVRVVAPIMMRQRAGKIINLSSISGEKPNRGQSNYAASKGAINAMTKAWAIELAKRNITVNAVAPGVIQTDMSDDVRDLAGEQILDKILLKRYGSADDVAAAIGFLASKYADYITGEILHVDGGIKMA